MKQFLSLLLFVFFALISYAQTADEYYELAIKKMEQKDYQYALVLIDKAIDLNDSDVWFWLKKADIQLQMDESNLAIGYILKAIAIDSTFSEPYNRAGSFYESRSLIDNSLEMYEKAIKYAENDTIKYSYIQNRGGAKAAKRDFEGALEDYETVLTFDDTRIGALNNIAPVYRQLGKVNEGIASLKKVIAIDDSFIGPYVNLGFAYSKMDSLDLAIEYFNKALEIDPNEALVFSNRGFVYYKKNEFSNALSDINKSISLYPSNSYAYKNLALVYIKMGLNSEACSALKYADAYGYSSRYGDEVINLTKEHCSK